MEFLRSHHYLGPLPEPQRMHISACLGPSGEILGVAVVGPPTAGPYITRRWVELRRLAVLPGAPPEVAADLVRASQEWAGRRGYVRIIGYSNPECPEEGACPADLEGGRLYSELGWRLDGRTHTRPSKLRFALDLARPP